MSPSGYGYYRRGHRIDAPQRLDRTRGQKQHLSSELLAPLALGGRVAAGTHS